MPRRAKDPDSESPTTSSPIKFTQICGGGDALYALSEDGKVFLYSDDDGGWFQLEFDNERHDTESPEYPT